IVQLHFSKLFLILKSGVNHTSRGSISTSTLPSIKLRKCSSKIITSILSFISGRLATKSNQIKQLIRRSEERFSRNAETELVCRLLLEKKKRRCDHYGEAALQWAQVRPRSVPRARPPG